jgi:hypothetical protein
MVISFEEVANATVQVIRGTSRGSGFHLFRPDLVVTNQHVLDMGSGDIVVASEDETTAKAKVLAFSAVDDDDFAILKLNKKLAIPRTVLQPGSGVPGRGIDLVFAGFPHGISDLLVQRACAAGPFRDRGFYLDGSINDGNSGGPVVDLVSGLALGIVTERRFLGGPDLEQLAEAASAIAERIGGVDTSTQISVGGVNFASVAASTSEALELLSQAVSENANVGIGIAYSIDFVVEECRKLGLAT